MKNKKGITLISLVITIIVLIILVSVSTYSGMNVINSSKFTAFKTELKIMQTQVNEIYQKYKDNKTIEIDGTIYYGEADKEDTTKKTILDIGEQLTGTNVKSQADIVFTNAESGITSQDGYMYWSNDLIKKLGIEGVEGDFFVNVEKRSIVSFEGFKYEGTRYYTIDQISDELYNVQYKNPNTGKPSFEIKSTKQGESEWKIDIFNVVYEDGYINKWEVKYQLDGKDFWNTSNNLSFVVNEIGKYTVKIINGDIEAERVIWVLGDGKWNGTENNPKFENGMQAVYWDSSNNEIEQSDENFDGNNWFDYVAGDNSTDSRNSHWANAKTTDGSYWVWIPRFEYKIDTSVTYTSQSGTSNKIEVKFIPTSQTTADSGYKIHPAFTDGTSNNFKNGEWDSELAGIWVAKYEMSMETNGEHTETSSDTIGNVATSSTVKVVSKPNVSSWRNITIGNSYTNAYNYDRSKESHLMKNSEWGAVAYLTQSQYGRNGTEISINQCSRYITGAGKTEGSNTIYEDLTYATPTTNQKYNGEIGQLSSSTGNIYGVYDLAGGASEQAAAYITNGNSSLSSYGSSFAYTTADVEGYKTRSTKYATVYPYNSSSDDNTNNYTAYNNAGYGYGDAVLETSSSGSDSTSWNSDYSFFLNLSVPFFGRGGTYEGGAGTGTFNFSDNTGKNASSYSFRAVLISE